MAVPSRNQRRQKGGCPNLIPNGWPKSVSDHDVDLVQLLFRRFRRRQQIPADLADVLGAVAVVAVAVFPEMADRKFFP